MGAEQCCLCTVVLVFLYPSLWLTPSHMPAIYYPPYLFPFKGNCSANSWSSLGRQRRSPHSPRCRCCSLPSAGISAVVLSVSLAWQKQGTGCWPCRAGGSNILLLCLVVSLGKEIFKPNYPADSLLPTHHPRLSQPLLVSLFPCLHLSKFGLVGPKAVLGVTFLGSAFLE